MSKTKTKTIFKGVINGVEFDNVAAYNKRLTELLAAGENVNASTSTSTVDICDCCGKVASECTCEDTCDQKTNMLPGFENDEAVENYVDQFVTGDDNLDRSNLESYKNYLSDNFEGVRFVVNGMNLAALKGYLNDLHGVLDIIDEDMQDTLETIHRREKELQTLHKAKEVLDVWNEYYMKNLDLVKQEIQKYDEKCNEGHPEPSPEPVNANNLQDVRAKALENGLLKAINSLLEAFEVKR